MGQVKPGLMREDNATRPRYQLAAQHNGLQSARHSLKRRQSIAQAQGRAQLQVLPGPRRGGRGVKRKARAMVRNCRPILARLRDGSTRSRGTVAKRSRRKTRRETSATCSVVAVGRCRSSDGVVIIDREREAWRGCCARRWLCGCYVDFTECDGATQARMCADLRCSICRRRVQNWLTPA